MALNKETMELVEGLLANKEVRFDWFMHILDEEKRKKIQELTKIVQIVVIPYALIIGVMDDEGKLTNEGCFTVKFDGGDVMKVVPSHRIGDGTYNEEAMKEGYIYPNGAPLTYDEAKEKMNANSEHGEAPGTTYGVPPVPSSADNPEWEGKV
jgi:hypothetical protein